MARSTVRSSESETSNPAGPTDPQRRGVIAGVSVGATALFLGCGKDVPIPPPGPAPDPAPGSGGKSGSGGASGKGGATGTGGSSTAQGGASGSAGGGGGGGGGSGMMTPTPSESPGPKDGGASSSDALEVRDGAKIEVGAPAGMPDGATAVCDDTDSDQLGPYHLKGHLMREVMATPSDGMPLVVTGRVLNTKCEPLAGAVVDVWAANGKGVYSENPTGWARGIVIADAQGNYKYQVVYPGPYQGRPRHIHLMIAQPGHTKLTTQMYFKGENPDIPANAPAKTLVNGIWQCNFNIVLRSSTRADAPAPQLPPAGKFHRRFWGGWNRTSKAT